MPGSNIPQSPVPPSSVPQGWTDRQQSLLHLAQCQLFFVGGAPRSGTTWLQSLLDSHSDISCRGEGLFMKHLAEPLDAMMVGRRKAVDEKNRNVFGHYGGYPLPEAEDVETLLGTAVLLALQRQSTGRMVRALGEKTPENVFFFPRLKRLFSTAKFIGIARDPRDVIASAWHFFHKPVAGEDTAAAMTAFIHSALPSLNNGARAMLALVKQHPIDAMVVTYETMRAAPAPVAARLFDFLGVADDAALVDDCVARTSFAALSGGRQAGTAQNDAFFRKGVVGDWKSTLTSEMNALILREMGWMFPTFGWTP